MNTQNQWRELARLQCEIDDGLRYNPASVFWQKANAILQLRKFKILAVEHAEQRVQNDRQGYSARYAR